MRAATRAALRLPKPPLRQPTLRQRGRDRPRPSRRPTAAGRTPRKLLPVVTAAPGLGPPLASPPAPSDLDPGGPPPPRCRCRCRCGLCAEPPQASTRKAFFFVIFGGGTLFWRCWRCWRVGGPWPGHTARAFGSARPSEPGPPPQHTDRTPGQIVHLRPRRSGERREGAGGLGRGGVGRGPAPWGGPGRPAGSPPGPGRLAAARDPAGCNRRRGCAAERCEAPPPGPRPLPPPLHALRRRRGIQIAGGRCVRAAGA